MTLAFNARALRLQVSILIEWAHETLKWLVAGQEMRKLARMDTTLREYEQWLHSNRFPEANMVVRNLIAECKGEGLDACWPPGPNGPWTLPGLRKAIELRRTQEPQ